VDRTSQVHDIPDAGCDTAELRGRISVEIKRLLPLIVSEDDAASLRLTVFDGVSLNVGCWFVARSCSGQHRS
jgi:hypothetical protein